jgi:EAL domain-containing protein (putative c-di-GMP-specific phosphodiesterase class I)
MADREQVMLNLQKELDHLKQGVMLVIRLLNKDELNILLDNPEKVIEKFYTIVDIACKQATEYKIIKTTTPTKLYILIPDNIKIAEKLAYSIYSQVQLYVDEDFPESYLRCSVGSIQFPQKQERDATKLLSLLGYGGFVSTDKSYYYSYDDNPIDIEHLRDANKRLNLLRSSLFQKKAKFMYQPIVDRKSGKIIYYECLLRVKDENDDWVSVGPMICDAESKGLISIVDFTVVEMAILELHQDQNITLSVNISNIGVLNNRLLRRIDALLKKYSVAERLIIEITETSLNSDFHTTKKFIDTLHKHGCKFALDDFGSGFTSFKQLLNLPIDIIKIDGSYIKDILKNSHSKFFVEALIKLAEDLGIKTVAEFVENGEIARFLIDIEVDGMQGNFFLPASERRVD